MAHQPRLKRAREAKGSKDVMIVDRYLSRQALWPFLAAVASLSLIALLTQSLATLDLIVDERQSVLTYLQITLLALPQLISLILPFALVIAVLYAVSRLQSDSELIVCQTAGMSRRAMASPFIKLSLWVMVVNLILSLWVQPTAYRYMRERLYEVRSDVAAQLIRPGEFRNPVAGVTFYAREFGRDGQLLDILVEDARDPENPITYLAQSGTFGDVSGEPALVLYNGSIQSMEANSSLSYLRFDSMPFLLAAVIDAPTGLLYKLSDRYLHELIFSDPYTVWDWRFAERLRSEGHFRISTALYNPAIVMLVLALLWAGEHSRMGYGRTIAIAVFAALFLRILGFAAQSAAADNTSLNVLQYVVPISAMVFAVLLINATRSRRSVHRMPRGAPA
jgi:lipopolysaccharide export system permease protein